MNEEVNENERSVSLVFQEQFAYHRNMDSTFDADQLACVAAAIAEPARARMLCVLLDQRARTSTELAMIAEVSPSTASAHLSKLREQNLLTVLAQGKHRYYQLSRVEVASALEALLNIASLSTAQFKPSTPLRLRRARSCYDHMAGEMAVALHDALIRAACLLPADDGSANYEVSEAGRALLSDLGVALELPAKSRRRYACACLDWSERRPHLGGALGANLLTFFRAQAWVEADLDSRVLTITRKGERQFAKLLSAL